MVRRLIDLVVAAHALVILSPIFALVALIVRVCDGRPVFFRQQRAGFMGVPFWMFKFRTMSSNAETSGGTLTFRGDCRITRTGRFLRRTKLDELPQLLNVLRGDMTLIGPRPEVLDWVARYTAEEREVLGFKPGLTDPVQVLFRHEQDFLTSTAEYEKLLTIKIRKQIEYLHSRNAFSDFLTILRTVMAIFTTRPRQEELAVYAAIRSRGSINRQGNQSASSPLDRMG
jgi:lipopolysaccharide/colanic/teichoic acid biosynthesis glycosyltransferase